MDFIVGFLEVQTRYNALWIIVDKLNKTMHFLPIKDITSTD